MRRSSQRKVASPISTNTFHEHDARLRTEVKFGEAAWQATTNSNLPLFAGFSKLALPIFCADQLTPLTTFFSTSLNNQRLLEILVVLSILNPSRTLHTTGLAIHCVRIGSYRDAPSLENLDFV